ncbi:hypothetical protein BT63DRAFT_449634 [Microthyrium microscopicum]|uniref:Uncharacterized protein n=1 Tax=Microthyrium microscopicum TaxID=703497 RepID=A0A6A6UUM7_9PEZI|nr:hypothetical protein BT63DRAFT_449634 [Microthyrium microscopicum]
MDKASDRNESPPSQFTQEHPPNPNPQQPSASIAQTSYNHGYYNSPRQDAIARLPPASVFLPEAGSSVANNLQAQLIGLEASIQGTYDRTRHVVLGEALERIFTIRQLVNFTLAGRGNETCGRWPNVLPDVEVADATSPKAEAEIVAEKQNEEEQKTETESVAESGLASPASYYTAQMDQSD